MSEVVETIEYKGFTINVLPDYHPMNPHTDWDGTTPMLIHYDRRNVQDYSFKDEKLTNPVKFLSQSQINRNWNKIVQAFGLNVEKEKQAIKDVMKDENLTANDARLFLIDEYTDTYENGASNAYDGLAFLWQLAGCAAISTTIRGYSQGDYANVLAVQTPKWLEYVGCPKPTKKDDRSKDIKNDIETYSAYAFGAVYGFQILDENDQEIEDSFCFGFYGIDNQKSGLLSEAQSQIDFAIKQRQAEKDESTHNHFEKINEMYQNAFLTA